MLEGLYPIIKTGSGCDFHRCILPLTHMGFDLDKFTQQPPAIKDVKVVFFNRLPNDSIIKVLAARQQYGLHVVVDLDDYWELYKGHPMYTDWQKAAMSLNIQTALRNADAVIVTTSLLADKVKELNKNVHVIPNALPFESDQFTSYRSESDKTRFVYAAGSSHLEDVKELEAPFKKINGVNASFTLAGYDKGTKKNIEVWREIEKTFSLNKKLAGYSRKYMLPLDQYMAHYIDADVALAPLLNNGFNQYKSNLKILEAGCKNIPIITSAVQPYLNEVDKYFVMYAKDAGDWKKWIKLCIEEPTDAYEMGLALGDHVRRNYDLKNVNEHRKQLFEHLMK